MSSSMPSVEPPRYSSDSNKPTSPLLQNAAHPGIASDPDEDFKYAGTVQACDLDIRMGFIRKVYSILTLQILSTTLVGGVLMANQSAKTFVQANQWMLIVAMISSFASLFALYWKRQSYPANFYLLGLFTAIEAYSVGTVTTFYDSKIVLEALLLTTGIFIALTLFTFQTKYDFVSWGSALYLGIWAFILMGFVGMFFPHNGTFELIYSGIGCLLFSAYILYDTQMIIKHVSVEDYIMASVSLYLDFLNLFLNILRLLNQMNNNN